MLIKKFILEEDFSKLEEYLRKQYIKTKTMQSWLPQRLNDLVYRMDRQYLDKGMPKSSDFITMWIENNEIVGCILPDGDAIYISTENENIFEEILDYAEENCKPLFEVKDDKTIDFLVVSNDSLKYREDILIKKGYKKQEEQDYDNYIYPLEFEVNIKLPEGFKLVYGNEYDNELNKWSACNLGFHPDLENPNYKNDLGAYNSRKLSPLYADSLECLVIEENSNETNDVCSYCFVYIDKKSKTAFIEPVSTREKYRHKGIGTAMMHGVINKCKELQIEKCYVNSYDWRRKFYNAAGFGTEDSIGFWTRKI